WAFAPARTSGVYRAIGIANAFSTAGWDVTVLTAPQTLFSVEGVIDPSLIGQVAGDVQIVEVPFVSGVYSADVTSWSWAQARQPELWAAAHGCWFPEHGFGDWRPAL